MNELEDLSYISTHEEEVYQKACELSNSFLISNLEQAYDLFNKLLFYKDARQKSIDIAEKINRLKRANTNAKKVYKKKLSAKWYILIAACFFFILLGVYIYFANYYYCDFSITSYKLSVMNPDTVRVANVKEEINGRNTLYMIPDSLFKNCKKLKKVTLNDDITSITQTMFLNCEFLEEVNMPKNLEEIQNNAFTNCTSLKSIEIPASTKAISDGAFLGCSNLENVTIYDSIQVISIGVFDNCNSLKFNETEYGCYLGNENNPFVVLVKIKNKDATTCVIEEGTKIILNNVFEDSKIININIPSSVVYVGIDCFKNCTNLENVNILPGLTILEDNMFNNCSALKYISIPNTIEKIINNPFNGCSSLEYYVSDNHKYLGNLENNKLMFMGTTLSDETIINIGNETKIIGPYAFNNLSNLEEINIASHLSCIGMHAFDNTKKLFLIKYIGDNNEWDMAINTLIYGYYTGWLDFHENYYSILNTIICRQVTYPTYDNISMLYNAKFE